MSDTTGAGGPPAEELQFDRADYTAPQPAATCRGCGQPVHDVYYEVNGQAFCQNCREHIHHALTGGSPVVRFLRATIYGSLAGLLGAAIYYGIIELTNINFGLIAAFVGIMVGKAVKKGSDGRGGWFYQALAIFLTYTAIVLTYIPPLIKMIADQGRQNAAGPAQPGKPEQPGNPLKAPPAAAPANPAGAGGVANQQPLSLLGLLMALVMLIGFAYAIPVIAGFNSPMLLIIAAFGLYEAWAINKRMPLAIRGPFRIGPADAGSMVHVEPAG